VNTFGFHNFFNRGINVALKIFYLAKTEVPYSKIVQISMPFYLKPGADVISSEKMAFLNKLAVFSTKPRIFSAKI
jgi:hypothetical protein